MVRGAGSAPVCCAADCRLVFVSARARKRSLKRRGELRSALFDAFAAKSDIFRLGLCWLRWAAVLCTMRCPHRAGDQPRDAVVIATARSLRLIEGAGEGGMKYAGICAGPDEVLFSQLMQPQFFYPDPSLRI